MLPESPLTLLGSPGPAAGSSADTPAWRAAAAVVIAVCLPLFPDPKPVSLLRRKCRLRISMFQCEGEERLVNRDS
jgi:hypothetical protein